MGDTRGVRAVWYWGDPDLPQLGHRITMKEPRPAPCNGQCPWLASNQDRKSPLYYDHEVEGIPMDTEPFNFSSQRRVALWDAELRDGVVGYASLCHVRLAGTELRPDDTWHIVAHQCTGALVMQQRELIRHLVDGTSALSDHGAAQIASQLLGREVSSAELASIPRRELRGALHPSLASPAIGCASVAPLTDAEEAARWKAWLDSDSGSSATV